MNPITKAIEIVGLAQLARECGVTYQALKKWERGGCLPRTEWTGETDYAVRIDRATDGRVRKSELLDWSMTTYAARSAMREAA